MIFKPRPWQKPIIDFVLDVRRCNIWADMGSGKTSGVLTALDILQMSGSNFFPALVLAPLKVARDVWPDEGRKWDHLNGMRISPIVGSAEQRMRALYTKADVYTMNYENIEWLVTLLGDNWFFKTVIADESTKLKGFRLRAGTQRSHALSLVTRKTHRWVNLTGTPAPNGLKDLWGQAWFLDYGKRLGSSWTAFKERWFIQDQYTMEMSPKDFAQKQIQEALADITLRVDMSDYMKLDKPIDHPVYVDLPSNLMKDYKRFEREMFLQLVNDIELTALTAAAKTTKCLQYAAGAVYYEGKDWADIHSLKLDALEEIVEGINGANLLVAYWWQHDLARLKKRFPYARQLKTKKDEADWNSGKIRMLLAHPQSAGHGMNLQDGGHHVCFFSDWWNLELRQQIIERIGPLRQFQSGYNRPVYLHQIMVRGTLDEDVLERHTSKADTQTVLMNAMKRRRIINEDRYRDFA
jgi:SNF2 family DNA or RNA helicase